MWDAPPHPTCFHLSSLTISDKRLKDSSWRNLANSKETLNTLTMEFSSKSPVTSSWAFKIALVVKTPPANAGDETRVQSLGWEDPLEEGMVTHSSVLAWRIPWTEELGRLQPIASQRVGHDWSDSMHIILLWISMSTSPTNQLSFQSSLGLSVIWRKLLSWKKETKGAK